MDMSYKIVEKDPTKEYVRYDEVLHDGPFSTLYKAFDISNAIEVGWLKVLISDKFFKSNDNQQETVLLSELNSQVNVLTSLNHENVVKYYHSWVDFDSKSFNLIMEVSVSGNVRKYCRKYRGVNVKAVKNWARQLLCGLDYLHGCNPVVVHNDLNCENIYVDGNTGRVKIGGLECVIVMQYSTGRTVAVTPEFMAPEIYEGRFGNFDGCLVDVYSFGMCVVEMVTKEVPYSECMNSAEVYNKVCLGIKPNAFDKVIDKEAKSFVGKCLAPVSERLSAIKLLDEPFLAFGDSSLDVSTLDSVVLPQTVKVRVTERNMFKLNGKMKGKDLILMTLWIADLEGNADKVKFVFFLGSDSILGVMQEMRKELKLSVDDASLIAELLHELITEIAPNQQSSEDGLCTSSVSTRESFNYEQDTEELSNRAVIIRSGSEKKKRNSRRSDAESQCSNDVISTINQEEKQVRDETNSQHKDIDLNPEKATKTERKWFKKETHNVVFSWLRKLPSKVVGNATSD